MPLIESTPDSVSRVYAKSLFSLVEHASGREGLERTLAELEEILQLARSMPEFGEFISSRVITPDRKIASLRRIFEGRVEPSTLNFLLVLAGNDRLRMLPAIIAAFDELFQKAFGRVEVDVYTASPIDEDDRRALAERIRSQLNREPVIHAYVDPTMIGGVRIQIGDHLIDASLSSRLRRLTDQLDTSGLPRVRSALDTIIDPRG
jgi:F-type H+-transporting ATPase subunit delta